MLNNFHMIGDDMFTHAETNVDTLKRGGLWNIIRHRVLAITSYGNSNRLFVTNLKLCYAKNNAPITNCLKYLQASDSAFLGPVVF